MKETRSLEKMIQELFGPGVSIEGRIPVSGGDINDAYRLQLSDGTVIFMKKNTASAADTFQAEAAGLTAIRNTKKIRVPEILGTGVDEAKGFSFLLLEYIQGARRIKDYWEKFAAELAGMHSCRPYKADGMKGPCGSPEADGMSEAYGIYDLKEQYGFIRDNYIGMTPQINTPYTDWISFFRDCRLAPQLERAGDWFDSGSRKRNQYLLDHLENWLIEPEGPSLIHGDLWGGNVMTGNDGKAWLIDPAAYFGHPEADLAMTELFGGFPKAFYDTYAEITGLDPGYKDRRDLYNLYHLLNHLNLFGSGYYYSVEKVIRHYAG